MTDPATTPGSVPAMSSRARRPPACPCRQRHSAPGVAMTLYSRLVGVTDGLGMSSTLTWNGSRSTVLEIPAGVVTTAIRYAAARARPRSSQCPARSHCNQAITRQSSNDRPYCGAQFLVAVRRRNASYIGAQQQNTAMNLCCQWSFESSYIHLPVMTAGHRMATRNSCTELVMPMENHQPRRKEHLDGFIQGRCSVTGRAAASVAAYWPHRCRRPRRPHVMIPDGTAA